VLSQGENPAIAPVTALWLYAVPLFDTVSVMVRRIWLKRSPFKADRGHLHHLLVDAGFRVRQVVYQRQHAALIVFFNSIEKILAQVPQLQVLLNMGTLFEQAKTAVQWIVMVSRQSQVAEDKFRQALVSVAKEQQQQ